MSALYRLWLLLITGFIYNQYFGWNMTPKNDAEMICDMVYALMCMSALTKD